MPAAATPAAGTATPAAATAAPAAAAAPKPKLSVPAEPAAAKAGLPQKPLVSDRPGLADHR
jgi:hypothetical protein